MSMSFKSEGTPRPSLFNKKQQQQVSAMSEGLGANAGASSTIKASSAAAWGSAGAAGNQQGSRSLWGIFNTDATTAAASAPKQQADAGHSDRNLWVPGGFGSVDDGDDDGDDGGGGGGRGGREEEAQDMQQFWKPASRIQAEKPPSVPAQQAPSCATQRLRRMSEAAASPASRAPGVKVTTAEAQSISTSPITSKKGRAKKNGKGKRATVEEVPDDEGDNRGEILPVDSRFLLEDSDSNSNKVILEPKPSVPPALYDSIISYTDEEEDGEDGAGSSAYAHTPSTAPSSPPDIFGGDEARMAAAVKELREGTSKMEKFVGGGSSAWGAAAGAKHVPWMPQAASGSEAAESQHNSQFFVPFGGRGAAAASKPSASAHQTPVSVWGQLGGKDKGKGKMTDSGGDDVPKAPNPTIQNLKRNKAAGGKLF
ncbi:hypothetical protein BDZ97DRAFT_1825308 [Flammula alnicola]|nr:hypothetical protein BDZ97DRAFT_1825308 [Flammula alnicola]